MCDKFVIKMEFYRNVAHMLFVDFIRLLKKYNSKVSNKCAQMFDSIYDSKCIHLNLQWNIFIIFLYKKCLIFIKIKRHKMCYQIY